MKLTDNAIKVLEKRYLAKDETGKLLEDPEGMFRRVAKTVAAADKDYVSKKELESIEQEFFDMMSNLEFLPNSPTLMNAGRPLGQLSACFVLPVEDTMEGIFESIKNAALIHKSGGGTGFSFSRLRPKGSTVNSTGGVASGPISFMRVFNSATEAVKQGGTRRGANMGILRVDHPDIREFITCKQDNKDITNFNISVAVTEEFMTAVENDEKYDLIDPRTKKVVKQESAREIFDMIVNNAWHNGEPGIIFLDRLNKDNVTPELGEIESTNPCITGDSWVLTSEGPAQVQDILGKEAMLALNGAFHKTDKKGFFKTGVKNVIKLMTDRGYELTLTKDHLVRTAASITEFNIEEEWKPAGELKPGDRVILSNNRGITWDGKGNYNEGYILGLAAGDTNLEKKDGVVYICSSNEEAPALMKAAGGADYTQTLSKGFSGSSSEAAEGQCYNMSLSALEDLAGEYGILPGNKKITTEIEKTSYDFYRGFLKGVFDSKRAVVGGQDKDLSIRLWADNFEYLKTVQRMLHRMGIASTIDNKSKEEGHELVIAQDNLLVFSKIIGFSSKKQDCLDRGLDSFKRALNRERFVAVVTDSVELDACEVYDVQVPGINAFDANGIYIHNCGEQPLLPFEACNLGSVNLSIMVKESEGKTVIDFDRLRNVVRKAVHFLDNVIDVNKYPLPEIDKMTKGTRKIGLGVMGWADLLCKLGIPYNSKEALSLAEKVMHFIQEESRKKSIEIAEKKGVFPYYDKSIYKDLGVKVRNATTTTIAPTGTLSIIAGVSSGIEPLFAISYIRNVMDNDELVEVNPVFKHVAIEQGFYSENLMRRIAKKGTIKGFPEIPLEVQEVFVTAHDISPEWHVKMQAAFQKYTDNAVSKTVNMPHDATKDEVKEVFELAYKTYCKGVTIYRDGSRDLQVLNIGKVKRKEEGADASQFTKFSGHIAPRVRPEITTGFTEKVRIGCGNLYITVNYDEYGICEVFTNLGRGGGCPSQSEATSRLVSIALRSGMDVKSLVEQLKGIRCASTIKQRGLKVTSCPDAIGRVIEKVMKLSNGNGNGKNGHKEVDIDSYEIEDANPSKIKKCPECGTEVEHEGGCVVCRNCGFSKCG